MGTYELVCCVCDYHFYQHIWASACHRIKESLEKLPTTETGLPCFLWGRTVKLPSSPDALFCLWLTMYSFFMYCTVHSQTVPWNHWQKYRAAAIVPFLPAYWPISRCSLGVYRMHASSCLPHSLSGIQVLFIIINSAIAYVNQHTSCFSWPHMWNTYCIVSNCHRSCLVARVSVYVSVMNAQSRINTRCGGVTHDQR